VSWTTTDGQKVDKDMVKRLVVRVMEDGHMNKFEACVFVAGMFKNTTGLQVLSVFDNYWEGNL
jgi:hypothetical protein